MAGYDPSREGYDPSLAHRYLMPDLSKFMQEMEREEETPAMPDSRHPSTTHLLRYFEYSHLPEHLQPFSEPFRALAHGLLEVLPDGPELTAGLRKLLEAKDCIVRAALDAIGEEGRG